METLLQDIRFGLRQLRKSPGFTLAAVLTLALGIGASTAFYSVVHAVLLQPLPYAAPEQLVRIWDQQPGVQRASVSPPEVLALREGARSLAGVAAYDRRDFSRTDGDRPERVRVLRSTDNLLPLLGISPALGRTFAPEDAQPGAPRVVLATHDYWKRQLGADPRALGRVLQLDGEGYTLVGVLPEGFGFGDWSSEAELWVPFHLDASSPAGTHFLTVVARLAPGTSEEAAQADVRRVNEAFWREQGEAQPHGALLMGWQRMLNERTASLLWTLFAAVGFVLLIACANVANLTLVRALGRQREAAIQSALGASRGRHVQQLLVETVLLGLLGGGLGLLLAHWGVEALRLLVPERMLRLAQLELSLPVLLFSLALSVGTGLLCGLVPALQASRPDVMVVLRGTARSSGARGRHPVRSALVVLQLALALVLLVGTGLAVQTLRNLERQELGFTPAGLLTARLSLPAARYPDEPARRAFWTQLLQRLSVLPGVEAAGAASHAPLFGSNVNGDFEIDGRPLPAGERFISEKRVVTPDYFRAMGVELLRGRALTAQDTQDSVPVVVVNDAFARRFFPGQQVLGQRLRVQMRDEEQERPAEVVGVVEDMRHGSISEPAHPEFYVPVAQVPAQAMTLVLRTRGEPASLAPALRAEVEAVDPSQPVYEVRTYEEVVAGRLANERVGSRAFSLFALLALLLAAVGTYGVMAYSVGQRTRELGIRRALGAPGGHVLGLVLGQGLRLTALALGVGLALALGLGQLLASSFYGVSPADPLLLLGVVGVLAAVALLACVLPALRATRVDPAIVLRQE